MRLALGRSSAAQRKYQGELAIVTHACRKHTDQESRLEAQGKFLALLLGDKAHLLTETIQ
jgi:hypothetical protein